MLQNEYLCISTTLDAAQRRLQALLDAEHAAFVGAASDVAGMTESEWHTYRDARQLQSGRCDGLAAAVLLLAQMADENKREYLSGFVSRPVQPR